MTIAVIDTLIQTVDFSKPPRSGLVKSAMYDVEALRSKHEVYYAYYGIAQKGFEDYSIVLDNVGAKDHCIIKGVKVSQSFQKIKQDTPQIIRRLKLIEGLDAIIVHVYSKSGYLDRIADKFPTLLILYVFHDAATNDDVFSTIGLIKRMKSLREFPNTIISTNSYYTRNRINKIIRNRIDDVIKHYDTFHQNFDIENDKMLFDHVYEYFTYGPKIDEIVDGEGYSINIGRYEASKGAKRLFNMHKHQNHLITFFGVQDPIFDKELKYYNFMKDKTLAFPDHYAMNEGASDELMIDIGRRANNLIISCPTEGFGYTAFEMGIYGVPTIVIRQGEDHATEEYLKKVGAFHKVFQIGSKDFYTNLYEAMKSYKITLGERKENAKKFSDYFSIENYITERETLLQSKSIKKVRKINELF